jgi:hypothetical protein
MGIACPSRVVLHRVVGQGEGGAKEGKPYIRTSAKITDEICPVASREMAAIIAVFLYLQYHCAAGFILLQLLK